MEKVSADLRDSTLATKKHIIELHIMPYFKGRDMATIDALDIKKWQNQIKKKFSAAYLNTIHGQLSVIFNHACKFYRLPYNPCKVLCVWEIKKLEIKVFGIKGRWINF